MITLLALVACHGTPPFECTQDTPCPNIGDVCVDGTCQEFRCANSTQCPMESHCDAGNCLPGCTEEEDCYPGYTCDLEQNKCVQDACTSTTTDCGFKQFCNVATGECYDAGGQYCKWCESETQEQDCGAHNFCLNHYCGVDCSHGEQCPAGFQCLPIGDNYGSIVGYQCFTYCWLFTDYSSGAAAPPTPAPGQVLNLDEWQKGTGAPMCLQEGGP
jgi:hypothetical protein